MLRPREMASAIIGASRLRQITEDVFVIGVMLPAEEWSASTKSWAVAWWAWSFPPAIDSFGLRALKKALNIKPSEEEGNPAGDRAVIALA